MRIKRALFLVWFFSYAYATDQTNIGDWTQNLLIETLSASYKDTPSEINAVQKNYLPYAWGPMHQFLLDKRIEINEKMLTLHPKALTTPQIMKNNDCEIAPCWQVIQSFNIPELSLNIDLSLQVIPGNIVKDSDSPFLVQSLSMSIRYY
ncbi:hypothetical protein [Legionella longbeachae]|uniref:Uncharacterized protein n=1 Tax=Legionella longbeachae serogroup 1 (strain NSW150) TaxID=661367 RepID=D3HT38_LEGLN|nr:hypothetical protein [Legionella longbeachae]VEE02571.1 Uncharacterised protein [Legionella oakridgensis]HBD7398828.1 hypothetical protein [Legionella pneumophila]ARB91165.1 hypothetical protein A6J40_02710 [Legionella longbeachae]ARM32408.1 hypothetical protein B0B39_02205 [Legionella longbeachae]EEZ94783.1 conserved hypothetical protein [Legionella longbeachae D-4968]